MTVARIWKKLAPIVVATELPKPIQRERASVATRRDHTMINFIKRVLSRSRSKWLRSTISNLRISAGNSQGFLKEVTSVRQHWAQEDHQTPLLSLLRL